jgi:FtsP/CotA-like multicopper oxidase with cupredoxin domain
MKIKSGITRRKVLQGLAAAGLGGGMSRIAVGQFDDSWSAVARSVESWNPLRHLTPVNPDGLTLHAAVGMTDVGGGKQGTAWLLNESLPSPFIRARRGERMRIRLDNDLPEPLILHWHGLTPPEAMDGHPRLAIYKGSSYQYDFPLENVASTYWYHSHTHHRVGKHAYFGIAGMLIVDDEEEEDRVKLPSGKREIPLVLQDRRVDTTGVIVPYETPDTMEGLIGNEPFGNGVNWPSLEVDTALYRFRVLNGSNARIYRMARNDGEKIYLIGNDGGLMERTVAVDYIDLAPGERTDLLLDFRNKKPGDRVHLGSRAYFIKDGLAKPDDLNRQGHPMDLMELVVKNRVRDRSVIPDRLRPYQGPDPADAVRERTFRLTSDRDRETRTMMRHRINNKSFRFGRIDEEVPFGETEIWTIINENNFSHPMHLHATHFRVVSRKGGRNQVMPWEGGLKDTVLIHPKEEVRLAVRFNAYPGLFLLHCHNLEHEDTGMMLNILVV